MENARAHFSRPIGGAVRLLSRVMVVLGVLLGLGSVNSDPVPVVPLVVAAVLVLSGGLHLLVEGKK